MKIMTGLKKTRSNALNFCLLGFVASALLISGSSLYAATTQTTKNVQGFGHVSIVTTTYNAGKSVSMTSGKPRSMNLNYKIQGGKLTQFDAKFATKSPDGSESEYTIKSTSPQTPGILSFKLSFKFLPKGGKWIHFKEKDSNAFVWNTRTMSVEAFVRQMRIRLRAQTGFHPSTRDMQRVQAALQNFIRGQVALQNVIHGRP